MLGSFYNSEITVKPIIVYKKEYEKKKLLFGVYSHNYVKLEMIKRQMS